MLVAQKSAMLKQNSANAGLGGGKDVAEDVAGDGLLERRLDKITVKLEADFPVLIHHILTLAVDSKVFLSFISTIPPLSFFFRRIILRRNGQIFRVYNLKRFNFKAFLCNFMQFFS